MYVACCIGYLLSFSPGTSQAKKILWLLSFFPHFSLYPRLRPCILKRSCCITWSSPVGFSSVICVLHAVIHRENVISYDSCLWIYFFLNTLLVGGNVLQNRFIGIMLTFRNICKLNVQENLAWANCAVFCATSPYKKPRFRCLSRERLVLVLWVWGVGESLLLLNLSLFSIFWGGFQWCLS